jgi:hypothetical protein
MYVSAKFNILIQTILATRNLFNTYLPVYISLFILFRIYTVRLENCIN